MVGGSRSPDLGATKSQKSGLQNVAYRSLRINLKLFCDQRTQRAVGTIENEELRLL